MDSKTPTGWLDVQIQPANRHEVLGSGDKTWLRYPRKRLHECVRRVSQSFRALHGFMNDLTERTLKNVFVGPVVGARAVEGFVGVAEAMYAISPSSKLVCG